ncbi:hybrid sensor histidine kinase/response regulator transcription factor [Marinoscillum luteum]|uniref:histidine kinase n=1 Tax=Marinoscillum luteum TaxID=861051 RepID=A0ABW7N5E2_9BACT
MWACKPQITDKKYLVGFSQCTSFDSWRKTMQSEMQRELSFHGDMQLVIKDAQGDNDAQNKHINELVEMGVDLLIISPNEAEPVTRSVDQAYRSGIPVILIDRKTNSNFYTAYVGANNYKIGKIAATYIASLLDGQGKVLEIKGLKGSTPFIERHNGFRDQIKAFPQIEVTEIEGEWGGEETARKRFVELMQGGNSFDLAFAHNDIMAYAAYESYRELSPGGSLEIIGVDALSGPGGGIDYVTSGILKASLLYPTGGDVAIQIASDILHGRPYNKDNELVTTVIDSSNVHVMRMQTNKILAHESDINRLAERIDQQRVVYKNQQYILYVIAVLFVISALSFAFTLKLLRERREINKSLKKRNEEVSRQKAEVMEMSQQVNKANQSKIQFFANISHELKTPLTLIQGPLDELHSSNTLTGFMKKDLELAQRNVRRLTGLVNQLMDFQKIENGRMKVRASKTELVGFLKEITDSFRNLAKKGRYTLIFDSREDRIDLWVDKTMIDKVFFNLLSNAFKFTPPGGTIKVILLPVPEKNEVVIQLTDTGMGMSKDQRARAFDRYYQGDDSRADGTGLGLALSRELIAMHDGTIEISSQKDVGTTFEVRLKMGDSHFSEEQLSSDGDQLVNDHEIEDGFGYEDGVEASMADHEFTVLIIEDNQELAAFLKRKLAESYKVLWAKDGEAGVTLAKEQIPDLILSDLMLPKLGGRDILAKMKSDVRTAHIPFIIMTASSSEEERVEGVREGADDYITKPFSFRFLSERIKTTLANRAKLREHYLHEIPSDQSQRSEGKLNKKFVNDFTAVVEQNIADQSLDVNVICESLGLSRIQLYRKVKAMLGYSVNDYITTVRLKKAKYLLSTTDKSIGEICYEVGFSSPSYFSSTFKSKFDISPSEYRQNRANS